MKKIKLTRLFIMLMCAFMLTGCVGKVVGALVDTTIEVAKIPFKVGAAVVDVATPNKKKNSKDSEDSEAVKQAEESVKQAEESLRQAEDALKRAEESLHRAKGSQQQIDEKSDQETNSEVEV